MPRPSRWRVRVIRSVEAFVDVLAYSAENAESEAAKVPFVVSVFPQSAVKDIGPADVHRTGEDE
jgi:hypothetical protein